MFKCKKCGQETGVFVQDVNGNYVCKECYLKQQKELGLTAEKELSTADKLLWLVENFDVTIVKDYTLCVLDRKEYARHRIVLNLNKVIESDISQKEAINAAYDWAKEEL